ncbi:MAG: peptidyl-prolyl cis-trans isomerase [Calditrichia bacterium]
MKSYIIRIILILGASFVLISGCHREPVPRLEIVARVGDGYLTRDDLYRWMPENVPPDQKETIARQYVERWVQKTALAMEAQKTGTTLSPYEAWTIDYLKNDMLARKYLNQKLPRQVVITDEEISRYYEKNKEEFVREFDEVHLVQLFLEKLDQAIASEIRESNSLLEVVEKNYLDQQESPIFDRNGDLGYIPVKDLVPEIARRVKVGKTGRIYGPIKIASGYYYFQMMDKQAGGTYRSLDLVKEEIEKRLMNIKRHELSEQIVENLLKNFETEIFLEHIN